MPSQKLIEQEEQEAQEEQTAQTGLLQQRIDTLKARIRNNNGSTPISISSEKYTELDTQEIYEVTDEIKANPKIQKIEVGVTVSEYAAQRIVRSFLAHEYADELDFNIFGRVNHPSQWRLMQTQADFEQQVESHNTLQKRRDQRSLLVLAGMHIKRRKRQRQEGSTALPALPTELLRDKLKPALESKKKRLIAE